MTQPLTSATAGPEDELTRNGLKPDAFADACRWIVRNHSDNEAHRMLDVLVTSLLTTLGFGEGMRVFLAHVSRHHADYPGAS